MSIMLGNVGIEEMQRRLGVEFPVELVKWLETNHQSNANTASLKESEWHCFDLPFIIVFGSYDAALHFYNYFKDFDSSAFKESLNISFHS